MQSGPSMHSAAMRDDHFDFEDPGAGLEAEGSDPGEQALRCMSAPRGRGAGAEAGAGIPGAQQDIHQAHWQGPLHG